MIDISGKVNKKIEKTQPKRISLASFNFFVIQSDPPNQDDFSSLDFDNFQEFLFLKHLHLILKFHKLFFCY